MRRNSHADTLYGPDGHPATPPVDCIPLVRFAGGSGLPALQLHDVPVRIACVHELRCSDSVHCDLGDLAVRRAAGREQPLQRQVDVVDGEGEVQLRPAPCRIVRTYVRMTSEGHAYARFQRALSRRNLAAAEDAARELAQLSLDDALQLVHLYAERRSAKFERAATRWLARYLTETSPALRDTVMVAAALAERLDE